MISVKRVYEEPLESDGIRILVDRLWPRGLSKDKAALDLWLKDVAPSDILRKWYNHESVKFMEFKNKYFVELKDKKEEINKILEKAENGKVTLLYSAKEEGLSNAVVLKEFLKEKAGLD